MHLIRQIPRITRCRHQFKIPAARTQRLHRIAIVVTLLFIASLAGLYHIPLKSIVPEEALLPSVGGMGRSARTSRCDTLLWDHVYNPSRLVVIARCVQVRGTVTRVRSQKDGDIHLHVLPDPAFASMLNEHNIGAMEGNLVVEPVCVTTPRETEQREACGSFRQAIELPKPGDRVWILGSFVLDTNHGWHEIHPLSAIRILGSH